jgi:Lon protease-like protein
VAEHAEFGLFPLATVLVPGEVLPLHIFEERYKRLFGDLVDGGVFGLIFVEEEGLREIGCTARLVEVVDHLEGGRLNVLVQGVRRFRLVEVHEPDDLEADFVSGVAEYVDDDESEASPELAERALEAFRGMLTLMGVEVPREPEGEGLLSYRMAAAVDFGAPFKQELLETLGESRRLELLLAIMATLMPRLELRAKRQVAIRGNGKGY